MARGAFRIVVDVRWLQIHMRIVAGGAGKVRILGIVAAAVKQTIGLETDIIEATEVWHHRHGVDAAMAGPTEFLR